MSLSPEAEEVLANVPWVAGNPWVISGKVGREHMRNLNDPWGIVRERAGLDDVRLHDLRHSFASRALALGEGLPMIGKLLGHARITTTERYAHLARDSVREAVERSQRASQPTYWAKGGGRLRYMRFVPIVQCRVNTVLPRIEIYDDFSS